MPQPAPAKDISIHDIEGLIAGLGRGRGPLQMTRQKPCVRHICERVPLQVGAGKDKGLIQLAADGGVDGQGYAHVHGIAECVSHDAVGPVDAPAEGATFCRSVSEVQSAPP